MMNPDAKHVDRLEGTALVIFTTSIVCGVLSAIVVSLRTYVRLHEKLFSWDDKLMLGGLVIYLVEVGLACNGALVGLGTRNENLNMFMQVESVKYLMIWMLLYIGSLAFIKSSICITMLRIASTNRTLRIAIYILLAVTIGTFATTFTGVLLLCRPVEANWDVSLIAEGKGECSSMSSMVGLSYTSTACTIATDLACAVLPGFILWNSRMKLKTKIGVSVLLSFGSLASISTMIRTPYIAYYWHPEDNLVYYIGNILLWSNVETAIGLIAGSIPSLRRLIASRINKKGATDNSEMPSKPVGLVTFGSAPVPGRKAMRNWSYKNETESSVSLAGVNERGDGDWRRLRDDSSTGMEGAP